MAKPTRDIAVFGAGGFGREVHMLIEHIQSEQGRALGGWNFIGYFDDGVAAGSDINGASVLGGTAELATWKFPLAIAVAIGNPRTKADVVASIAREGIEFPALIHPSVIMGNRRYIDIGSGCIICAGNILTANIRLGKHVILNLSCTTGHDVEIGDYASFMPGVNISGEVVIGMGVYVGTGAKIINQVRIGDHTVVGAGAVVVRSLPPSCTAVGIPAKPIRTSE